MCEGFGGVIRCGGQIVGRHPKMKVKETTDIVVFIPHTPEGILKERLQRRDAKMREAMGMWRVMFMEREGEVSEDFCADGGRRNVGEITVWCARQRQRGSARQGGICGVCGEVWEM